MQHDEGQICKNKLMKGKHVRVSTAYTKSVKWKEVSNKDIISASCPSSVLHLHSTNIKISPQHHGAKITVTKYRAS